MSNRRILGELSESKPFEWKIPNYSSWSKTESIICSPSFTFQSASFYLSMVIGEFLDMCLINKTQYPFNNVLHSFGIKKSDGKLTGTEYAVSSIQFILRFPLFFEKRLLEERKSELLPSDALTIVCDLKLVTSNNCPKLISTVGKADCLNEKLQVGTSEPMTLAETDVLSKNFRDLFTNKVCCDTVLKVKDKEFEVHKLILIARSSVFAAMFKHDTSEKETGVITIPDCDSGTFHEFLEYMYCGKLGDISFDSAVHLYRTSDKYDVQELKTFCPKYMVQNLKVQYVCDAVILADEYDETELFSAAQRFFNENLKEVLVTSEWESLLKTNHRLANKLLVEMSRSKCFCTAGHFLAPLEILSLSNKNSSY